MFTRAQVEEEFIDLVPDHWETIEQRTPKKALQKQTQKLLAKQNKDQRKRLIAHLANLRLMSPTQRESHMSTNQPLVSGWINTIRHRQPIPPLLGVPAMVFALISAERYLKTAERRLTRIHHAPGR